jgi:serine/threonine protein kinase
MQIPGYTIEHEIGHGGMATVYLAVQNSLGRPVALKVMSAALAADRTFSERFIKEARTIALLSHPHIVAVHDVGVAEHTHYLALEYIAGGDLKACIRRGPTPPDIAFRVVRDIASALGYAHSKGFVHRDVKPENILFREGGMAVLTDFGIARAATGGTRMTGMGMSIGTPHYMSPEQARGKDVDGRADIYALGIVLYEMLTGTVPYDAEETLAIGIKHVTDPVPVLPPALSGHQPIIDRMLAKDPNDRYRTAEDLVVAIAAHDPNAKPRTSGSRAIPSIPLAIFGQPALSKNGEAARPAVGLKWALLGGVAAIFAFGVVWMTQQGSKPVSGGGGTSVAVSKASSTRLTDLETALVKPSNSVPVAVKSPNSNTPEVGAIESGYRFKGGDPSDENNWEQVTKTNTNVRPFYGVLDADKSIPSKKQPPAPVVNVKNTEPEPPSAPVKAAPPAQPKPDPVKIEHAAWQLAEDSGTAGAYKKYLKSYPGGSFAVLAKTRLAKLGDAPGDNESSAWQLAEQTNTRAGYERYLAAFPSGTYAVLCKARLKRM